MILGDSHARWVDRLKSWRGGRVAVIGDVMLDRYIRGRADRLSPEAPVAVLEVEDEGALPGGAANVAMKVLDLGGEVHLVGAVGDDRDGGELRAFLAGRPRAIDGLVTVAGRPTTVKTRVLAQNQQLLRLDRERREGLRDPSLAASAYAAALAAEVVVLEDYGKGVLVPAVIEAALAGARARSRPAPAPIIVDPKGHDYRRYAGATVLTPNLREVEVAVGRAIRTDDDLRAAAGRLIDETEGAALAVTRESRGISLFRREGDRVAHTPIPTVPVAVYDVTGAGDAVVAGLALALADGYALEEACAVANLAGRAVVRQLGVGTLSIDRLLDEVAECAGRPEARKVVGRAAAAERVAAVRRAGGTVVFTNGCFDILHHGHAHLLQFARAQGDFLVLGLNSDASIRRLKGPDRPYVACEQRAQMLALYPFVDLVVAFDEDTPLELIEALGPDVLVKGGDYTPETVVGREAVESRGGRVVICPRLEGLSTTDIVRTIHERRAAPGAVDDAVDAVGDPA